MKTREEMLLIAHFLCAPNWSDANQRDTPDYAWGLFLGRLQQRHRIAPVQGAKWHQTTRCWSEDKGSPTRLTKCSVTTVEWALDHSTREGWAKIRGRYSAPDWSGVTPNATLDHWTFNGRILSIGLSEPTRSLRCYHQTITMSTY